MAFPHHLELTPTERTEVLILRDTARWPYPRERAAAPRKVADGEVAAVVARTGLPRPRQPDTLDGWLHR